MATGNSGDAQFGLSLDEWLLSRAHLRFVRQMMIDHIWTTRRAESKTSNPQRLPLLGNFNNSPSDECVALSTFVAISNGKTEKEGHGQTVLDPRSEVDSNATTCTRRSEDLRPAARKSVFGERSDVSRPICHATAHILLNRQSNVMLANSDEQSVKEPRSIRMQQRAHGDRRT